MTNKFKYLYNYSLKKKIKSKSFLIVNIILLVLISAIINIDSIIKYFGGDFEDKTIIYVVDNTNEFYDTFSKTYNSSNVYSLEEKEVEIKQSKKSIDKLKKELKQKKKEDIIVEINKDNNEYNASIISYGYIDAFMYQSVINTINNTKVNLELINSDIDTTKLSNIYKEVEINRVYLNKDLNENEEFLSMLSGYLIPIFIIPFFILIILVIQMIGAEINEEKSSRSMEIIMTSVSPKTHFMSKVLAVNVFVFLQTILVIGYLTIGLFIRKAVTKVALIDSLGVNTTEMLKTFIKSDLAHNILKQIPLIIVLFILSFIAYTLFAGVLASMTTSMEDYQQLQTPIMIVIMIGYYLAIMASTFDNSSFIKAVSVIPFISVMLAPVLLILGQIGVMELIISLLLLIIVIVLFLTIGMRIYKSGILNYSSNKLWTKILKSAKQKS